MTDPLDGLDEPEAFTAPMSSMASGSDPSAAGNATARPGHLPGVAAVGGACLLLCAYMAARHFALVPALEAVAIERVQLATVGRATSDLDAGRPPASAVVRCGRGSMLPTGEPSVGVDRTGGLAPSVGGFMNIPLRRAGCTDTFLATGRFVVVRPVLGFGSPRVDLVSYMLADVPPPNRPWRIK